MTKINERLETLRNSRGWTKAETARRLELKAPSTYGNWEYGIREPDLVMLQKLAELFEVSVDFLLNGDEAPQKPVSSPDFQADLKYRLEKICETIQNQSDANFGGNILTDFAAEYLVDNLRFVSRQAEKINIKQNYTNEEK
ncbi:helix-turn-helix domain-containing protein [Listeria costaricensis]|uniref:helix-turn-helix domain-containing protein n=1 Tax=Listeria costaricensis TaxID=2026604 RepID=UPI000C089FD6|nr:helix-turn-helix transcriptional regulator [Listeria costaricensis]